VDLVMTFANYAPDEVSVDPSGMFSDHGLVTCRLLASVGQATIAERLVSGWRRVDRAVLRRALDDSPLCQSVPEDADVDDLFATYYDVLREVADRLAPQHALRRPAGHLAPWFDADCRVARRHCRRLERRYRRTCQIAVCGSMLYATYFDCVERRRWRTGWIVFHKTGTQRRSCGGHRRQCWVVIVIHLGLLVTPLVSSHRSLLVKSTTSGRQRLVKLPRLRSNQRRPRCRLFAGVGWLKCGVPLCRHRSNLVRCIRCRLSWSVNMSIYYCRTSRQ